MGVLFFLVLLFVLFVAILIYVLVALLGGQLKWLLKPLGILILVLVVFLLYLLSPVFRQIVFY